MAGFHNQPLTSLGDLGAMLGLDLSGIDDGATWGNADTSSFTAEPGIPFKMYTWKGTSADVSGRPQAMQVIDKYFSPTTADSAEAFSAGAFLVASPVRYPSGMTQTFPVVGVEGDGVVQSNHTCTNKVIGVAGAAEAQDTAQVTNGIAFYAAGKSARDAGATMTNAYGLYVEAFSGSGTVTNKWGVYSKEDIQTEKKLVVGNVGAIANAQAYIKGPNVSGGATDQPALIVDGGAGATAASLQVRTSGGSPRIQLFGASGNLFIGNSPTGGSGVGEISIVTTTAPSGTPPAAGAYIYVDPADNKLKAKTSGGTVTVITPTA